MYNLQRWNLQADKDQLMHVLNHVCEEMEIQDVRIENIAKQERKSSRKFDNLMQEVMLLRQFKHD
jgi:D-ribose pyranose/furanose isomerase RbsD